MNRCRLGTNRVGRAALGERDLLAVVRAGSGERADRLGLDRAGVFRLQLGRRDLLRHVDAGIRLIGLPSVDLLNLRVVRGCGFESMALPLTFRLIPSRVRRRSRFLLQKRDELIREPWDYGSMGVP